MEKKYVDAINLLRAACLRVTDPNEEKCPIFGKICSCTGCYLSKENTPGSWPKPSLWTEEDKEHARAALVLGFESVKKNEEGDLWLKQKNYGPVDFVENNGSLFPSVENASRPVKLADIVE